MGDWWVGKQSKNKNVIESSHTFVFVFGFYSAKDFLELKEIVKSYFFGLKKEKRKEKEREI